MKRFIILLAIISFAMSANGRMKLVVTSKYTSDSYYDVWQPEKLKVGGVVVFFHGKGEKTLTVDEFHNPKIGPYKSALPAMLLDTIEMPYTVIVVQLRSTVAGDWPSGAARAILPFVNLYSNNGQLPRHVTGLSLGGIMVHMMIREALAFNEGVPGFFTTAGAVCGAARDTATTAYKGGLKLKLWHGEKDTTVPPGPDITLYKRLSPIIGTDHIWYKEYPGLGHDIWNKVYNEEYLQFVKDNTPVVNHVIDEVKKILIIDNGYLYIETDKASYALPINQIPK